MFVFEKDVDMKLCYCCRRHIFVGLLLLKLSLVGSPSLAIETAGELFVDLDAASLVPGDTTWTNPGSYADFVADGTPMVTLEPVPSVFFDGASAFVGQDVAPDGLVGFDPTRSIEAWVFNPSIASEETVVSWGKRGGGDGTNMAFNYGNHGNFGAVGHWGGGTYDLGWIDNDFTPGAPEEGQWHHLAYTYDEEIARVYADGVLMNEEDMIQYGGLDTHFDTPIAIASQWESDGTTLNGGLKGSMFISRVRIHDGVLNDAQIAANYDEEKAMFTEAPMLPPEPPKPDLAGLWRFDDNADLGLDSSSSLNQLSESGGISFEENGRFNGSAEFDGIDGMLNSADIAADLPSDGPYTVAAWIKPEETGARGIVGWGNYGSGSSVNALRIFEDNGFRHYWWGNDLDALDADVDDAGVDLDDGEWHHVLAVFDGDERSLYLNGELLVSDVPGTNNATGANFAVGRTCTFCGGGEFFSGQLDDVAVFNIALTEQQIQAVMSGDFSSFLNSTPGDLNGDGVCDASDIDALMSAIRSGSNETIFDVDNSGVIDDADLAFLVIDTKGTWFGDSNLDGEFTSGDFVVVFQAGLFETGNPATWASGDWNGDGEFTAADFVKAFQDGGFEQGPRAGTMAVPEPGNAIVALMAGMLVVTLRRRRIG